jgi:hypothetical protein
MDTNAQVILVLKLALNIAPPALYFVILGLVNSQSRPHVISSRKDWLALIVVFSPVLLFPALWLASGGFFLTGVLAVALAGLGVYFSLPKPQSGWVIYNCSRLEVRRALFSALTEMGIDYEIINPKLIHLPQYRMDLSFSSLPLLKNTTITVHSFQSREELIDQIENCLRGNLDGVENALNPSGPAMLIAGSSMLILPLLMMVRHIDAFVRVVCDLLPV